MLSIDVAASKPSVSSLIPPETLIFSASTAVSSISSETRSMEKLLSPSQIPGRKLVELPDPANDCTLSWVSESVSLTDSSSRSKDSANSDRLLLVSRPSAMPSTRSTVASLDSLTVPISKPTPTSSPLSTSSAPTPAVVSEIDSSSMTSRPS